MPKKIWESKGIHNRNIQQHLGLELMKSNTAAHHHCGTGQITQTVHVVGKMAYPSRNIWACLIRIPRNLSEYLGILRTTSEYLGTPMKTKEYIGMSRNNQDFWGKLRNTWGCPRMYENTIGMLRNTLGCPRLFRNTLHYLEILRNT